MHESRSCAPLFTARVNDRYAVIRVRGHLDRLGAEDLATVVERLCEQGHHGITLETWSRATTDAEATTLLAELAGRLAQRGVLLAVA